MTKPVMEGAEPLSADGGAAGALVLHGFTGSPHEMRGIAEQLADAGLNVELPLLPGHGTSVKDLVPVRWSDWVEATEAAYLELATRTQRVAVVGLSMGGGLACRLAANHPEIAGLTLINPFVQPPDDAIRQGAFDLLEAGTEIIEGDGTDIADPDAMVVHYDGAALPAALSLFDGVGEVSSGLPDIRCPVLLFSSRNDHVVPASHGDLIEGSVVGPCERVWCERSFHVAPLDYDRDEIEARTVAFVTSVTSEVDA